MLRLFIIGLLLLCCAAPAWAQQYKLLQQQTHLAQVESITQLIYNAQFQQAAKKLSVLREQMPADHPVLPLLQAIMLYWQDAPMHTASKHFEPFIVLLHKTNQLADAYLAQDKDKIVTTFCTLTAHSLLARYHAEKGEKMAAIKEAKATYGYMKEGFSLQNEYNEFFFSTGLYNYYRVKYPELNPIYKPFMWLFEDGDIKLGLQQLEYAARNTVFTKVEAASFLVHLYLYYENKPHKALSMIRLLYEQFPKNRFIRLQYTESLLAAGQYQEAAPHIAFLQQQQDAYYRATGTLFAGILAEKHQQNPTLAYQQYKRTLDLAAPLNYIADTYRSMAHAGIARYYDARQQKQKAQQYWQTALELASYEYPVKQEALQHLR